MRRRPFFSALAAALVATLPGCASSSTPASKVASVADAAAMTMSPAAAEFPASAKILDGFELADSPEGWRTGDRVLLGIRVERSGGVQVRYLLVELTDRLKLQPRMSYTYSRPGAKKIKRELDSILVETNLTLYDEQGVQLEQAAGKFPVELLGSGLYDGAEPMVGAPTLPTGEPDLSGLNEADYDHAVRGWLTLVAFSGSMNKKGMFRPLIEGVIAKPSLIALLLNPSFGLGTSGAEVQRGEPWSAGAGGQEVPTVRLPITCTLAGSTCATAQVLAAKSVAPLSLCGGVVRLVGRNPADDSVRFELRLLATKRGPLPPPLPDPTARPSR